MTKLKTSCPSCEKRLRIDEAKRGKSVRCPACGEKFTVSEAFTASEVTIDTAPAAVSVDTTELSNKETLHNVVSPGEQSREEQTLRKLGRFELKSVLGAGGFGKVYRAYDPQLERFVALKVPTFGPNQKTRIQRFLTEAKSAARLKHANIVTTFESGKADKKYYIASEYIDGDLLSDLTKKERPGVEDSVQIVRKLAEALAYAHGQGVVHRDIKPHNVMIDNNGEPQLMDFGLAKRTDDSSNLTTDGALLGTPAYMSPEQARGELHLVNSLSDQYSLGVVLYHLLTGGTPCEGSPHMVIAKVAKGEFHSVREWNARIDPTLDAVCQKAMHPEQGHRYADCSQFATDLDAWSRRKPVIARPLTKLQKLGRTLVDHQLVVGLFAIILVLSAAAAVLGFKVSMRDDHVDSSFERAPDNTGSAQETGDLDASPRRNETEEDARQIVELIDRNTDLNECVIQGKAFWAAEELVLQNIMSSRGTESLVELPVELPDSYDLKIVFTKDNPKACFAVNCPHNGSELTVVVDGWSGSGISNISELKYSRNSSHVAKKNLVIPNQDQQLRIRSTEDGVFVFLNESLLTQYIGDPASLSVEAVSRHPNTKAVALRIAHDGEIRVRSARVEALEGQSRQVLPPYPSAASTLARLLPKGADAAAFADFLDKSQSVLTVGRQNSNEHELTLHVPATRNALANDLSRLAVLQGLSHLTIEGGTVRNVVTPKDDPRWSRLFSELHSVQFWNVEFPPEVFEWLAQSENLTELDVSHCALTESEISQLCQMKQLNTLKLDGCRLTGTDLEMVVDALPSLSTLSVSDQRVADGDVDRVVQALASADSLRAVNLQHWNTIGDELVDKLAELTQLTSLNLNFTCLSDTGFQKIQDALPDTKFPSKFKSIPAPNPSAGASRFSQQELDALRQSHGDAIVDVLNIPMYRRSSRVEIVGDTDQPKTVRFSGGDDFSDGDLLAITKLQGPVEISARQTLTSTSNDPRLFEAIGRMPELIKFSNWNNHGLGKAHFDALSASESLKELSTPYQGMSVNEVASIAKIASLERLDVTGTAIDNEKLELICKGLKQLRILYISEWSGTRQKFDDSAIVHLQNLKKLETLAMTGCEKITDGCISHLSGLASLKALNISKTSITNQGATLLRQLLPKAVIESEGLKDSSEPVTAESLGISLPVQAGSGDSNQKGEPPQADATELTIAAVDTTTPSVALDTQPAASNPNGTEQGQPVAANLDNATLVITTSLRRDVVKDVQVELIDEQKNQIAKTRSDNRGRAVFRNLQPGNYEVVCKSQITVSNAERKRQLGHLHRPTREAISVDNAGITQHRVSLLPLRSVKIEYAEVVPNADIVTYTSGTKRNGAVSEAVTSICHFPLVGRQNRTQSPIRIESSVDGAKLLLRCLPSGEVFDLGNVEFATAGGSIDDWRKLDGQQSRETIEGHTYLIQHNDGRRFKLRVSELR